MTSKKTWLWLALLAFLPSCAGVAPIPGPVPPEPMRPAAPKWTAISFSSLPGWEGGLQSASLPALVQSCSKIERLASGASFAGATKEAWAPICGDLARVTTAPKAEIRAFYESHFQPFALSETTPKDGLFTAYYEPLLEGSRTQDGPYQTPLWQKPGDMLTADLGAFDPGLSGRKLTGKVDKTRFVPFDSRKDIAAGSLKGRAAPLLFVRDPVEAFFLEIQGSGLVKLQDGQILRVAYDAQNGRAYVPLGRVLVDQGKIERPVSMPKIKAWLRAHPDQAQKMMNENGSHVFFRLSEEAGAKGAQGLILTPGVSMAVDPSFVPLGSVLWLSMRDEISPRVVLAQDTGGAIKGRVRGDLFLGPGPEAEKLAGALQSPGLYYLLWPKGAHAPD